MTESTNTLELQNESEKEKQENSNSNMLYEENLLELLIVSAYTLYSTNLIKHYDYFHSFEKGDLVMEITSLQVKSYNKKRIGYLKEKINDYECIIETLDGQEAKWENSQFIKVPTELFEIKKY